MHIRVIQSGLTLPKSFDRIFLTELDKRVVMKQCDLERPATLSAEYAWSQTDAAEAPQEATGLIESLERLLAARLS
jgi:hypothetical protein